MGLRNRSHRECACLGFVSRRLDIRLRQRISVCFHTRYCLPGNLRRHAWLSLVEVRRRKGKDMQLAEASDADNRPTKHRTGPQKERTIRPQSSAALRFRDPGLRYSHRQQPALLKARGTHASPPHRTHLPVTARRSQMLAVRVFLFYIRRKLAIHVKDPAVSSNKSSLYESLKTKLPILLPSLLLSEEKSKHYCVLEPERYISTLQQAGWCPVLCLPRFWVMRTSMKLSLGTDRKDNLSQGKISSR